MVEIGAIKGLGSVKQHTEGEASQGALIRTPSASEGRCGKQCEADDEHDVWGTRAKEDQE